MTLQMGRPLARQMRPFEVMTAGQQRNPPSVATDLVRLTLTLRNGFLHWYEYVVGARATAR